MKYHITIWADDGMKRDIELEESECAAFCRKLNVGEVWETLKDSTGRSWFFNRSHILGGTVRKVENEQP